MICDNSLYIALIKTRGKNVSMKIIKEFNIPTFTRPYEDHFTSIMRKSVGLCKKREIMTYG